MGICLTTYQNHCNRYKLSQFIPLGIKYARLEYTPIRPEYVPSFYYVMYILVFTDDRDMMLSPVHTDFFCAFYSAQFLDSPICLPKFLMPIGLGQND